MIATLETALTTVTANAFLDPKNQIHEVVVEYCGKITDEIGSIPTSGTLSFKFEEVHAENSPFEIEMIPGPLNL